MRALTNLKQAGAAAIARTTENLGKLPMMALARIHPDPRNKILRDKDALTPEAIREQLELDVDIKKVGIKSPLSLRPHPEIPGDYIVNHGHRRRLAAINASLTEVPYFIDEKFTSYDQVKENLLRRNLTPWAYAEFIKSREAENESRTEIAEGLGKGKNFVTEHAVLIDAPACLHIAYDRGVKSARTLYDLNRAYQEFPEQVDDWCVNAPKITRDTIQQLVEELRNVASGDQLPADDQVQNQLSTNDKALVQLTANDQAQESIPVNDHVHDKLPTDDQVQYQLPVASKVRHDEQRETVQNPPAAAPKVRHDEQVPSSQIVNKADLQPINSPVTLGAIAVQYKGKSGRIAPNTVVVILMDGEDIPVEVPVTELVFKGTGTK